MLKKIGDNMYCDWQNQKYIRVDDTFYPIYHVEYHLNEVHIINEKPQVKKKRAYLPPTEVNACDLSGGG